MTIRHIIVEGMDGTGKDGFIDRLTNLRPFTVHERASTSLGGPVANLTDWVVNDMRTMPTTGPWVYNRHPLVSEPIYAPIARKMAPQGLFADHAWVAFARQELAKHALLVLCLPPWNNVRRNIMSDPTKHMPGVAENAYELYKTYRQFGSQWQGTMLYWDYTASRMQVTVADIDKIVRTDG